MSRQQGRIEAAPGAKDVPETVAIISNAIEAMRANQPKPNGTAQCHQDSSGFKGATGYHVGQARYFNNQFPENAPQPMGPQLQWNVFDQYAGFGRMCQYFMPMAPIMILPVQAPFYNRGCCPGGAHCAAKQIYVVEQGTQTDALLGQESSPKKEEKKTTPPSQPTAAKGITNQNVEQPVAVRKRTVVTTVSGTAKVSTVTQTCTPSTDKGTQAIPEQSIVKMANPVLVQLEENWKDSPKFTLIREVDRKQQAGARRVGPSEEAATVVQGQQATKPVEPKKSIFKKPAPPHTGPGPKSRKGQKNARFADEDEPTNERPKKRHCKTHNNFERTCKLCNDGQH